MKLIPRIVLSLLLSLPSLARAQDQPPPAPREFRGTWVATVSNINWPSKPGLPVEQQRKEMIQILDRCAALRLNAILLQVRPAADAMYPSTLEPWSEFLTGTQGRPPSPQWDPLREWVDEAHKRGMELHAWFNPYRVKANAKTPIAPQSIAKRQPQVVKQYGNLLWMDPGEPLAAQHTLNVILDIVRRYDVDGIHTDDYYYPYKVRDKETNKIVDFPDQPSYERYRKRGGKLDRADWRRDNVNQLIERIYVETRKLKPWVKVGYAPFGIWKPQHPPGIEGLNQYDELYADAKLWLNQGWLDYVSPQLYWPIGGKQDFAALLKWWTSENTKGRHVWPGMSVARHPVEEVVKQIVLTREAQNTTPGSIIWSVNSVLRRPELYDRLQAGPFAQAALVPPSPWLDKAPPAAPNVTAGKAADGGMTLALRPGAGEPTFVYAVWARYGQRWHFTVVPGGSPSLTLNVDPEGNAPTAAVVTSVDRTGNESPRVSVKP